MKKLLLAALLMAMSSLASAVDLCTPNCYVRSGAAGTNDGTSWANAYTTLAFALTTSNTAGNNFWVADDHAEATGAAVTLTSPGTSAAPIKIVCVNHLGSTPPVAADLCATPTAVVGPGAVGSNLSLVGHAYHYGITYSSGTGSNNNNVLINTTNGGYQYFDNCLIKKAGTLVSTGAIGIGGSQFDSNVVFNNTPWHLGNGLDTVSKRAGRLTWQNTANAIQGTTLLGALFGTNNHAAGPVRIIGVDLSMVPSLQLATASPSDFYFEDSKLPSDIGPITAPTSLGGAETYLIRSGSSAVNYTHYKAAFSGTLASNTSVVRTGGATNGTTPMSWKIDTTAGAGWVSPFSSLPMAVWNDTVGSNVTVEVYGTWGEGAVPKNDDIWLEVRYLGSASSPMATFVATTKASLLAADADVTSDASSWSGGTTPFKLSATLSAPQPAQAGDIYVTVKAAKPSTTFYIDPVVRVAGVATGKSRILAPGVFATDAGGSAGGGSTGFIRLR